jgi:hypothetical protein
MRWGIWICLGSQFIDVAWCDVTDRAGRRANRQVDQSIVRKARLFYARSAAPGRIGKSLRRTPTAAKIALPRREQQQSSPARQARPGRCTIDKLNIELREASRFVRMNARQSPQ